MVVVLLKSEANIGIAAQYKLACLFLPVLFLRCWRCDVASEEKGRTVDFIEGVAQDHIFKAGFVEPKIS